MKYAIVVLTLLSLPGLSLAQYRTACPCTGHGNCTCAASQCSCGPCGKGSVFLNSSFSNGWNGGFAEVGFRSRVSVDVRQERWIPPPQPRIEWRQSVQWQPQFGWTPAVTWSQPAWGGFNQTNGNVQTGRRGLLGGGGFGGGFGGG
jgi:hypothetical protein